MKTIFKSLLAVLIIVSFYGCVKGSQSETCSFNACGVVAPQAEVDSLQKWITNNNITATKHCSGMFYRIETEGTGKAATACSYVGARYKGTLLNGNVFDQATSTVGFSLTQVIRGWMIGVPLVKTGGKVTLYIPPTLAYGAQEIRDPRTNNLIIPANSSLVFEVDLDGVQ